MRDPRTPTAASEPRPSLWGRLLNLGRRAYARLFGRKRAKNPNIYPLY